MSSTRELNFFKNIKKAFIDCFKITILLSVIFSLINQRFTIEAIFTTFLISATFTYGLGFSYGLLNDYLNSKWDWVLQTRERIIAGVIGTIVYTVPVVLGINYFIWIELNGEDPSNFFEGNNLILHCFFILISLSISTFYHAKSFMVNWKSSITQKSTKQEIVAKTETAKFESLKSQIDPHFLFNSLNVLTSLISENPNQAEKFTTKLSKVYRYVLEQRNKDLIPLTEEINFAKTYMELLEMRFEDAVRFEIPSTVSDERLKIVPLSLQLLLENALKHNVVSSSKPLTIRIYEENNYLIIENNINPKETIGKSTRVGLRNIADRYGLITKQRVIIENNNKIFRVSLPLLNKIVTNIYSENMENSKYVRAVERMEKLKEFYQNLASYIIVIPFLIFINLRVTPGFQWFWFPMFGWGIGIIFHWLEAYNYNIFLGKNWEEKKMKEILNEDNDLNF